MDDNEQDQETPAAARRPRMTVKGVPKDVQEDITRCARQHKPTPLTIGAYVMQAHQQYQMARNTERMGPTIEADGGPPQAALAGEAVPLDVALRVMELAAIKGNGGIARLARELVRGYLAPHVPERRPRVAPPLKLVAQP